MIKSLINAIKIEWDTQFTLTNLKEYHIQVSENDNNWYALRFDGGNWFDGEEDGYTTINTNEIIHTNIPIDYDSYGNPMGRTLYYRVRRVTILDAMSDWSDSISSTTKIINDHITDIDNYIQITTRGLEGTSYPIGEQPTAGAYRVRLDANEITHEKYNGYLQKWVTYNKIGGDAGTETFPYIQTRGLIKNGAEDKIYSLDIGRRAPEGSYIYDFEGDYKDKDEKDLWDSKVNIDFNTSEKIYGTYSLRIEDGESEGYIKQNTVSDLRFDGNFSFGSWVNITEHDSGYAETTTIETIADVSGSLGGKYFTINKPTSTQGYNEFNVSGKSGGDNTGLAGGFKYHLKLAKNSGAIIEYNITPTIGSNHTIAHKERIQLHSGSGSSTQGALFAGRFILLHSMNGDKYYYVWWKCYISDGKGGWSVSGIDPIQYYPTLLADYTGIQVNVYSTTSTYVYLLDYYVRDATVTELNTNYSSIFTAAPYGGAGGYFDITNVQAGHVPKHFNDPEMAWSGLSNDLYISHSISQQGTTTDESCTFTDIISKLNTAISGTTFSLESGDLRCTSNTYGNSSSIVLYENYTISSGQQFVDHLTGWSQFESPVAGENYTGVDDEYYVWYNTGASSDPSPGGTGIEVSINIDDSANTVASNTQTEIDAITNFTATVENNVVTVICDFEGSIDDAADVDTGFTIDISQQGNIGSYHDLFTLDATGDFTTDDENLITALDEKYTECYSIDSTHFLLCRWELNNSSSQDDYIYMKMATLDPSDGSFSFGTVRSLVPGRRVDNGDPGYSKIIQASDDLFFVYIYYVTSTTPAGHFKCFTFQWSIASDNYTKSPDRTIADKEYDYNNVVRTAAKYDDDKFICFYGTAVNDGDWHYYHYRRLVQIDGTNQPTLLGTEGSSWMDKRVDYRMGIANYVGTNVVAISYKDYSSPGYTYTRIVTISGTTVTFKTAYEQTHLYYIGKSLHTIDDNNFILYYTYQSSVSSNYQAYIALYSIDGSGNLTQEDTQLLATDAYNEATGVQEFFIKNYGHPYYTLADRKQLDIITTETEWWALGCWVSYPVAYGSGSSETDYADSKMYIMGGTINTSTGSITKTSGDYSCGGSEGQTLDSGRSGQEGTSQTFPTMSGLLWVSPYYHERQQTSVYGGGTEWANVLFAVNYHCWAKTSDGNFCMFYYPGHEGEQDNSIIDDIQNYDHGKRVLNTYIEQTELKIQLGNNKVRYYITNNNTQTDYNSFPIGTGWQLIIFNYNNDNDEVQFIINDVSLDWDVSALNFYIDTNLSFRVDLIGDPYYIKIDELVISPNYVLDYDTVSVYYNGDEKWSKDVDSDLDLLLVPKTGGYIWIGSELKSLYGDIKWREVDGAGEPEFSGSWENYGGDYAHAGFRKDCMGFVHLRGLIKSDTDGTIFTLPSGYRPDAREVFSVSSDDDIGRIDITSAGVVTVSTSTPVSSWISLSGIKFYATD